jgi:hypothetical protein
LPSRARKDLLSMLRLPLRSGLRSGLIQGWPSQVTQLF